MKGILKPTRHDRTHTLKDIAHQGDAVLYHLTKELLEMEPIKNKRKRSLLPILVSNKVISTFRIGFTVKVTHRKSQHYRADMTEAWIWFLFVNYGKLTTMRYLRKELRRYYRGQYFIEADETFWTGQKKEMVMPHMGYYELLGEQTYLRVA